MTYAQGGKIQASDYNSFVSSVNAIWGTGTGSTGYGQSSTLSTVATSDTVTATQWATLIARIDSMRQHQSGVTSSITQPTSGDTITYLNTLSSQISTANTNRGSNNEGTTSAATAYATGSWNGTSYADRQCTFTFASANAMRYFFNCGGTITFNAVSSDFSSSGTSKNDSWDTVSNNLATQTVSFSNFWSLGTSFTTIGSASGSGADYASNTLYLQAKLDAAPGSSTVITLRGYFVDNSADVGAADNVDGTARIDATANESNTTYITKTWGTVTGANNTTVTQDSTTDPGLVSVATLTYVASAETTSSSITIPASAAAGDLGILLQVADGANQDIASPSGWTERNSAFSSNYGGEPGLVLFSKLLDSSDPGASLGLDDGAFYNSNIDAVMIVVRPDIDISGQVWDGENYQWTTDNPSPQTVTVSSLDAPLLVYAGVADPGGDAVFTGVSPAMTEVTMSSNDVRLAYTIYNNGDTPVNQTVDANDLGSDTMLISGYVKIF